MASYCVKFCDQGMREVLGWAAGLRRNLAIGVLATVVLWLLLVTRCRFEEEDCRYDMRTCISS